MAVYTKINRETLESFLKLYNLGKLLHFNEIKEGVENSNYKLTFPSGSYILTIFEKRIDEKELPFFVNLKIHLFQKKFLCPEPIKDIKGIYINKINNKSCLINSFIEGKKLEYIKEYHCKQLGTQLAKMHMITSDFKLFRKNTLSQKNWKNLFNKLENSKESKFNKFFKEINSEIEFLEKSWPNFLPQGIIHADVFKDNVLFDNDIFSGIIDFYFACNDCYAYELAICINAWCFNTEYQFEENKSATFLDSYQNSKQLSKEEKKAFPILLRGAAMRFLLTRLYDYVNNDENAYVDPKDPMEYFHILQFHRNNFSLKIF